MKHLLPSILLLTFLFPAFAQGQSLDEWIGKGKGLLGKGKGYLCETTGVGCPKSVDFKDLIKRDGLYFKKFTDVPFTGKSTGEKQGSLNNGKMVGPWINYWSNGHLRSKGNFKDGKKNGLWVFYRINGQLSSKETYKNGWKVR